MENDKPKSEPIRETAQTDKQGGESQEDKAAPPLIGKSPSSENAEPKSDETESETDRKQDEAIDSLAEQTSWIARQTRWLIAQVIISSVLTVLTLGILVYHGIIMGRQSQAMKDQTDIMRGQLESMNSGSKQTQDLIEATQKSAIASQSIAERNKDLVEQAGKQANASTDQAKASLAQAQAANKALGFAASSARAAEQSSQIASQTFAIGERPYITVKDMKMKILVEGQPPYGEISFANLGRTPALNASMIVVSGLWDRVLPENPSYDFPENPAYATSTSMGGNPSFFMAAGEQKIMPVTPTFAVTNPVIEAIKNRQVIFYVYGKIEYDDGVGKHHTLKFCGFYNQIQGETSVTPLSVCPQHNSSN